MRKKEFASCKGLWFSFFSLHIDIMQIYTFHKKINKDFLKIYRNRFFDFYQNNKIHEIRCDDDHLKEISYFPLFSWYLKNAFNVSNECIQTENVSIPKNSDLAKWNFEFI